MQYARYYQQSRPRRPRRMRRASIALGVALVLLIAGTVGYKLLAPSPVQRAANKLQFAASVSEADKQTITKALMAQHKTYDGSVTVAVEASLEAANADAVLDAYVPVATAYATRQQLTKDELGGLNVYADASDAVRASLAKALGLSSRQLQPLTGSAADLPDTAVAFIPASKLSPSVKLLGLDDAYYLDSFTKGAVFRQVILGGSGASGLAGLRLNTLASKDTTLKVNMTGVTALTRLMMKKLGSVKDPKYFSKQIGSFLADADITHVSNEVSFKTGCQYSNAVFCAPPEMIETLKDSGIDVVELTGNHNNDSGNQYNTESINLYTGLGWHTFGGGLNTTEAVKPYEVDLKQSKVAFLGYNAADAPGSGAIASSSTAGANSYDASKAQADITAAKQRGEFVIVDVQYSECYAYPPGGYVEFPECDVPISGQKALFRNLIDMGADMVIGTQAHQPQTYELYNGKPIYYGLGNLYFEQTQQPGTERGVILTHYFIDGKLVQTKLSPTVYDAALQTHLMGNTDALKLLERLKTARQTAGL